MSETRHTADGETGADAVPDVAPDDRTEVVADETDDDRTVGADEGTSDDADGRDAGDRGAGPAADPGADPASGPPVAGLDRWLGRNRVVAALYAALAVVLTWPLVAHLTDSLPYGTEDNPTVQLFNLWTMRWNQDRLGHLFAGYWDAPIFHPTPGAFALSEPQPLTGLLFSPLSWLSGNPVLALNLVLLGILAANGWAAARLARRLGAAPAAAFLAGVLAEGMPFVAAQMGVLQLTAVFPLFLLVDAIVRWAPAGAGGRRRAAEIGLWLAVTFLTCGYYGLFALVGIGVPALLLARRRWLTRARALDAAVAAAVFAALALPLLLGQARITSDYERPEDVVRDLSAGSADFWQLEERATGAGVLPWVAERTTGNGLYPGTALLALGLGGAVVAYRRLPRPEEGATGETDPIDVQRRLMFLVLGAILARALSLGLHLPFGPYRLVRAVVPGFESLRSPFRFAVLTEVFLVALAALALDALWRWRPRRADQADQTDRRGAGRGHRPAARWGALAAVLVVGAGVVEVGIMPVPLFRVDQRTADWAEWIHDHPHGPGASGDGSFAYLPFPPSGHVDDYADTTRAMLQSLDSGAPTVNGYSGLFPPAYEELEGALRGYPSDEADALLRERGVSYLVVDRRLLDDRVRPWLDGRYPRAFEGRDAIVYAVL